MGRFAGLNGCEGDGNPPDLGSGDTAFDSRASDCVASMARWSSGMDTGFSTRRHGFDPRTRHPEVLHIVSIRNRHYVAGRVWWPFVRRCSGRGCRGTTPTRSRHSIGLMGTVTSRDGTVIGFTTVGEGPPMVLVHGTTADHIRWDPVLPRLAERYTVHAVDRRGRGLSGDGETYDIRREGEDIAAVVDAVGPGVYLVAHSYGARCSLEAALLTSAIDRIVLYEPPGVTPGQQVSSPDVLAALRATDDRQEILTIFYRGALRQTDEQIEAMRGTPVWQARLAAAHTVSRELDVVETFGIVPGRYTDIDVPVRLLLGTESPAYFRATAAAIAAQLTDAEIVELPGQAHMAINEAPELFVDKVFGF
jgi:pimeloyl-ACP methyl ester carboxylesterase